MALGVRGSWQPIVVAVASLVIATLAIAVLQEYVGVRDASSVYLVAVVATAIVAGTPGAVAAAASSFLLYDFLFIEPIYTFTVADPREWLNLILLLFVGIVVGQLAALQRSRAYDAREREREALALFRVSRTLATRETTPDVLPAIAAALRDETRSDRVWITLGTDEALERMATDTEASSRPAVVGIHHVLRRMPGEVPAQWVRVHHPVGSHAGRATDALTYRVRIEAGGETFGSIWSQRPRSRGDPDGTETRLLSAAADQLGQVLAHDRLAAESRAAEIARQSDALKTALLQSVSHDLRTPLATIRAAAGSLGPGTRLSEDDQRESVEAIDREVEYLDRLVTNLLDLSRIEAGALRTDRDLIELDDLLGRTLARLPARIGDRPLTVELEAPSVFVDPVLVDQAVTNALDNAIKYTAPGTPIRVTAHELGDERYVRLTVEDGGPGVPDEQLARIFEKFYRVPGGARRSRSGMGIGLAVTRGLIEATGGRVAARRSDLGGLAIDLDLPIAASEARPTEAAESPTP